MGEPQAFRIFFPNMHEELGVALTMHVSLFLLLFVLLLMLCALEVGSLWVLALLLIIVLRIALRCVFRGDELLLRNIGGCCVANGHASTYALGYLIVLCDRR